MKNRIKIIIAAAMLIFGIGGLPVCAEKENTFIISYEAEGAVFDIYRAGEFNEDLTFSLSGDFADCADSLNLSGLTASGWTAAAKTLYNYAFTYDISPVYSRTISDGTAEFSGLDRGLYLVSGSEVTTGGYTYTSETFLVCLPNLDEDSEWTNTVAVSPKFTKESESKSGGSESEAELFTLLIIWEGDNDEVRPETVVYTIYKDGEVYTDITLSEENNWQYELTDLEVGYTWTVIQGGLPGGYSTTIENSRTDEGTEVVITNIYAETTEETSEETSAETTTNAPSGGGSSYVIGGETTTAAEISDEDTESTTQDTGDNSAADNKDNEEADNPDDNTVVIPGSPEPTTEEIEEETVSEPETTSESGEEKLPQTGQLWMPVPVLVFCGLVLFIIGYIRYKRNDDES